MGELYIFPQSGEGELERPETSLTTPEITGDPVVDELLQAASKQAIEAGPPAPDPRAFMNRFWARHAASSPEDPTDPEPPHTPPAA